MDKLKLLYSRLPYSLKIIVSSIRGYQLKQLRYGKETERLVTLAIEREAWSKQQWETWQAERLDFILNVAATKVPYYESYWQNLRKKNIKLSWYYLENWPILDKETVRKNPWAFVNEDLRKKSLYIDHTGGTTGIPTLIYESRDSIMKWYALNEARLRGWFGVNYKQTWGMFAGQQVIPLRQRQPPYWVYNRGLNQIYFSIFHITEENAKYYVAALNRYAPTHLIVYPSIMAILSRHIIEQNLSPPNIKVIFCNSEKVLDRYRLLIHEAFNCPIINTYGMAELTSAGSECEAGSMHQWPEVGILEVYNPQEGNFIKNNKTIGEFVMTGLLNEDMPLIRYKNGDLGSLPTWDFNCKCGRNLPKFGVIQGRENDFIQTIDGRQLYILDSLFNGMPIVEAQLIQESLEKIIIKVVPEKYFEKKDEDVIRYRLLEYLGDVQILITKVGRIPRDGNGKFRPYISNITRVR